MDFTTFITTATVGAVPLVFVIIGLVEYFKKLGVKGTPFCLSVWGSGSCLVYPTWCRSSAHRLGIGSRSSRTGLLPSFTELPWVWSRLEYTML